MAPSWNTTRSVLYREAPIYLALTPIANVCILGRERMQRNITSSAVFRATSRKDLWQTPQKQYGHVKSRYVRSLSFFGYLIDKITVCGCFQYIDALQAWYSCMHWHRSWCCLVDLFAGKFQHSLPKCHGG